MVAEASEHFVQMLVYPALRMAKGMRTNSNKPKSVVIAVFQYLLDAPEFGGMHGQDPAWKRYSSGERTVYSLVCGGPVNGPVQ
jgi:hypothetical protein